MKISNVFKTHKSYTVEEVLATGELHLLVSKQKNKGELIEALKNAPFIKPFTDEEWADHLAQIEKGM